MRSLDVVEVKNNLKLRARERGKIVARRDGHNIWLDIGREYLSHLIALTSYGPDVPQRDDRIKYMGFGIGGTRQSAPGVANVPPMYTAYPGTNVQTDLDPAVLRLERPVRISGSTTPYPGDVGDVWLGTIQAPAIHTTPREVTFRRLFTLSEVNYSTFSSVPLSEVGLYTSLAVPIGTISNSPVAYDTFDTISKTGAFEIEVEWTVRF